MKVFLCVSEKSSLESSQLIILGMRPPVTTEILQQQHLNLRTAGVTQVVIARSGAETLVPPILFKQTYLVGIRQGKSCSLLVFVLPSAPPAGTLETQMELKVLGFNRSKSI